MTSIKKYFLIVLLLELFFAYAPAYAQNAPTPVDYSKAGVSDQIAKYLCAPKEPPASQTSNSNGLFVGLTQYQANAAAFNNNSTTLYDCINQVYKFSIVVAAVVGVFFIVIAGYVYMSADGNEEGVTKAKEILTTTITSLVILM